MSEPGLAETLRTALLTGFSRQAEAHGREMHRKTVEARARDPLAWTLAETFTRQRKTFAHRAQAAAIRGDRSAAVGLLEAAERAGRNAKALAEALTGEDANDQSLPC